MSDELKPGDFFFLGYPKYEDSNRLGQNRPFLGEHILFLRSDGNGHSKKHFFLCFKPFYGDVNIRGCYANWFKLQAYEKI